MSPDTAMRICASISLAALAALLFYVCVTVLAGFCGIALGVCLSFAVACLIVRVNTHVSMFY